MFLYYVFSVTYTVILFEVSPDTRNLGDSLGKIFLPGALGQWPGDPSGLPAAPGPVLGCQNFLDFSGLRYRKHLSAVCLRERSFPLYKPHPCSYGRSPHSSCWQLFGPCRHFCRSLGRSPHSSCRYSPSSVSGWVTGLWVFFDETLDIEDWSGGFSEKL